MGKILIAIVVGAIIGFCVLILIEMYLMWLLIFRENKKKVLEDNEKGML